MRKITLDLSETHITGSLVLQAGGSCDRLEIFLTNKSKPYSIGNDLIKAVFYAKKPDGTVLFNACETESGKIIYDVTNQTISTPGIVECQIILYFSDEENDISELYTPVFDITVTENISNHTAVESSNEFSALTAMIQDTEELICENSELKNSLEWWQTQPWWFGTRAEYNALTKAEKDRYVLHFIEEGS